MKALALQRVDRSSPQPPMAQMGRFAFPTATESGRAALCSSRRKPSCATPDAACRLACARQKSSIWMIFGEDNRRTPLIDVLNRHDAHSFSRQPERCMQRYQKSSIWTISGMSDWHPPAAEPCAAVKPCSARHPSETREAVPALRHGCRKGVGKGPPRGPRVGGGAPAGALGAASAGAGMRRRWTCGGKPLKSPKTAVVKRSAGFEASTERAGNGPPHTARSQRADEQGLSLSGNSLASVTRYEALHGGGFWASGLIRRKRLHCCQGLRRYKGFHRFLLISARPGMVPRGHLVHRCSERVYGNGVLTMETSLRCSVSKP